jgi:cytochrome c
MDSFEINKILGAVLGTCLGLLVLNITAGAVFSPQMPAKPGYEIAVKEAEPDQAKEGAPKEEPITALLATASAERGTNVAKQCAACHTFEKGGPNRVGPNLWGIVGRPVASHPGFNYSAAMKAKGGTWTIEELNEFLRNPRAHIPGTAMTYAGLPRGNQRADLIAYLNTLSDNPQPLPKAADAKTGDTANAPPPAKQ